MLVKLVQVRLSNLRDSDSCHCRTRPLVVSQQPGFDFSANFERVAPSRQAEDDFPRIQDPCVSRRRKDCAVQVCHAAPSCENSGCSTHVVHGSPVCIRNLDACVRGAKLDAFRIRSRSIIQSAHLICTRVCEVPPLSSSKHP